MKFHEKSSLVVELLHVDGRTDMTRLAVSLRNCSVNSN